VRRAGASAKAGRNLLANNIIRWPTIKTSFLIVRMGTYNIQINAIRKPMKLAFCRLASMTT
jgi:hypothetical protein